MGSLVARRGNPYLHLAARYWGWLVVLVVVYRLSLGRFDWWSLVLSLSALLYFSLVVPAWCGAVTRGDRLCRNNAHGLLMGCHLREHRFQKLSLVIVPKSWRALMRRVWDNPLPTTGAVVSLLLLFVSTSAAVVQAAASVVGLG